MPSSHPSLASSVFFLSFWNGGAHSPAVALLMVAIARPSSSRAGKAQRRQEVAAAETAVQEANLAQQRAADQLLRGLEALPFAALRSRTRRRTHFPTLVEHNGTLGSSGIRALLRCLKLILIKASTLTDQLQREYSNSP